MQKFPHLFSPLKVNRFTYKNRIVTAPMGHPLRFQSPGPNAHYKNVEVRAKGGAAAVTLGEVSVNFADAARLSLQPFDFNVRSGPNFEGIKKYADIIHQYGALATIEIFHPGQEKDVIAGTPPPRGPMSYVRKDGAQVEAMDEAMMDQCCHDFATCAAFMQAAGYEGVLTHSAHGWLFSQFLSPLYNQRTDKYGGSLENRARFPLEIFQRIRERVGPDFIIEARINGRDGVPGGMEADEVGQFVHMLEGIVDAVHISAGRYEDPVPTNQFSSMFVEHGCNAGLAAIVKKYTSLPVGVVGGINSPEMAEQIIAEGKADYVVLARQAIADPEFPNKAQNGREAEIRRCVRCYVCMPGSPHVYKMKWDDPRRRPQATCAINPDVSPNFALEEHPEPKGSRNVLVAGGGVAGMQAAITAAERGHRVTLAEKSGELGGILKLTDADADKEDLRNFKDLLIREVNRLGVDVKLNMEITPDYIKKAGPDAIILALGSSRLTPPIPGIETALHCLDVYDSASKIGKRVVMVGGGLAGCETALHLAATGHAVTVIEMLEGLASDSFGMYQEALIREMEKRGIVSKLKTRCLEITPAGVKVEKEDGGQETIEADTVVYALGMQANSTAGLHEAAGDIPVYDIGDCVRPAQVLNATEEAYAAAMQIL